MNLKEIYELWDRFEVSKTSELELDMQGVHLVLKKQTAVAEPVSGKSVAEVLPEAVPAQAETPEESIAQPKSNAVTIKAPLMGTFYRAAAPGEAPFVSAGDEVHKGDVVGIIEAMKLMNEITAPEDGVIAEILAEDGSIVEFNQVLMALK